MSKVGCAIIGSGNIGTDLMIKIMRLSPDLKVLAMAGVDPLSDGLARARRLGVAVTSEGVDGLVGLPEFKQVRIVYDATSAGAHARHDAILRPMGRRLIDLTPAAIGPFVVPSVNLDSHLQAPNVNLVTCGGQATIPIVHAVSRVTPVRYAEIVASIASKSAGVGTRANIDEFTVSTSRAIVELGGATAGKAIIVLNPAEPPLVMRDTVFCLAEGHDEEAVRASVEAKVREVAEYVPGYRMKQAVQFEHITALQFPDGGEPFTGMKVSVFLEVEGMAHYLPAYAGNLDIMTSAAVRIGEQMAQRGQLEAA
ncbi:MAG: acetaldehyde dehydrogenase (acetylating) [Pseudomonadota bacterium]|uniref:acetaldehyde dehydrogenase (acetylating) n=1 Tax=Phenylobacterium sp. TaxID=1871053 RepID=UPI0025E6F460|nr:acetaldehyde dehydrogenase (acetylating) [Phenylobacterium sp.]MBT9470503.1 acetaldehyde dehydrogenase (acetylating) [Phenylobacterium sp.]